MNRLLFCAVFFLSSLVLADDVELDEDGLLNVGDEEAITLHAGTMEGLEPLGIIIEQGGMLIIAGNTEVYLKGVQELDLTFDISVEGTLRLLTSDLTLGGTKASNGMIYSGELVDDEELEGHQIPKYHTLLYLNEGTIEIAQGNNPIESIADAGMVDIVFGTEGGTIDVASNLTFQSGNVYQYTQTQKGEGITKTGTGSWHAGIVSLGTETFNLLEGTVDFSGSVNISTLNVGNLEQRDGETGEILEENSIGIANVHGSSITIGTLNLAAGTVNLFNNATIATLNVKTDSTISGLQISEPSESEEDADVDIKRSHLTLSKGGKIEGTLEDVGTLILSGGTLSFEGGSHSLEKLGIARNATMNLQTGTGIQLLLEDAPDNHDDIIVEGTLKISAGAAGFYRGEIESLEPGDVLMTIAGSTNNAGDVIGGIVHIYKSDSESEAPEILSANTLHTQVIGIAQIIVEEGVTFQSGTINYGTAGQSNLTGAHMLVSGGGTYRAGQVDLGTGYLITSGEGTTVELLENVTAGAFISQPETHVFAHGNAEFITADIAGNYRGNSTTTDLTIKNGASISGHVTGINNFQPGGELALYINAENPTMISTNKWEIAGSNSTIRVVGAETGNYANVIEVKEGVSNELLALLNSHVTALNKPQWSIRDGTLLDLQLSILTVDDYIKQEWGKKGRNIRNVGRMIEKASMQNPELRQRLEGFSDAQLRTLIRRTMAGELAGNAARFAMQQPASGVFRNLDGLSSLQSDQGSTRGQVREGFSVWFNPYGQSEHADGDGNTFDGYTMSRYGFQLGVDMEIYHRAVAGVFFGYTNPYVKSDLGRISANDYTAGVYARMPVEAFIFHAMAGFGVQDYSYKYTSSDASFRGASLFANIELLRPIPISTLRLTPLVAMDFQTVGMQDFIVRDPTLGNVLVSPGDLESVAFRVGLLGDAGRFRSRVQYIRQIDGDDFVSSRTSLSRQELAAATRVRGTQWGKDWINLGIGCELISTQHWRIFADYDFDLGKQTTSHLGSLTAVLGW